MLNIQQETLAKGTVLLSLSGAATVEYADGLRTTLLEALQQNEQVQIDCSQTENIDFFAIQLLCSAHRSSVAWEKQLVFKGTPPEQVCQSIERIGFKRDYGCHLCPEGVRCMWMRDLDS